MIIYTLLDCGVSRFKIQIPQEDGLSSSSSSFFVSTVILWLDEKGDNFSRLKFIAWLLHNSRSL